MANRAAWTPNWAVPPGDILLEALEERDLSQAELARRMDRPVKTINEIVKGKAAITPATAIQLERALGIDASLWTSLETSYRQALARIEDLKALEEEKPFLKKFPVRDLVRLGHLRQNSTDAERVGELLTFFGVSSANAWRRNWAATPALRESASFTSSPEALATWLRLGQLAAERVVTEDYRADRFRELLVEMKAWTRQTPMETVWQKMVRECANAGVALVLIPEVAGTRVNGAAHRTARGVRIIQLSGRYRRDDQFWFTLFHEAGHLLLTPDHIAVDVEEAPSDRDKAEALANSFARDCLISPERLEAFISSSRSPTEGDIRSFARSEGVAVGVVVGRLQKDRIIDPSSFNYLKKKVDVAA